MMVAMSEMRALYLVYVLQKRIAISLYSVTRDLLKEVFDHMPPFIVLAIGVGGEPSLELRWDN